MREEELANNILAHKNELQRRYDNSIDEDERAIIRNSYIYVSEMYSRMVKEVNHNKRR